MAGRPAAAGRRAAGRGHVLGGSGQSFGVWGLGFRVFPGFAIKRVTVLISVLYEWNSYMCDVRMDILILRSKLNTEKQRG